MHYIYNYINQSSVLCLIAVRLHVFGRVRVSSCSRGVCVRAFLLNCGWWTLFRYTCPERFTTQGLKRFPTHIFLRLVRLATRRQAAPSWLKTAAANSPVSRHCAKSRVTIIDYLVTVALGQRLRIQAHSRQFGQNCADNSYTSSYTLHTYTSQLCFPWLILWIYYIYVFRGFFTPLGFFPLFYFGQ